MKLVGDVAIVTGGSKGIGYGVADLLMANGANVVISSRNEDELHAAAAALTDAHHQARALPVVADVAVAADIERLFEITLHTFGAAKIVVNNAGIHALSLIEDLPEADWDRLMDTNLKGPFLGTRAAIRQMRAAGTGGAIVNISSIDAFASSRGNAHYSATKAGIDQFTAVAALEAGRHGIRVNAVAPGAIRTPMGEAIATPEFTEAWERTFVLGRTGHPLDIAQAVAFLASDYASWVTGITLLVDGGTHLCGIPDYAEFLLDGTNAPHAG